MDRVQHLPPLVSVIIPVYNTSKYIRGMLDRDCRKKNKNFITN